jgi:1-phosphatidylinositol-3-phosphate 5-kinase
MLRGALWNDTNFLQNVNVMDYSLLVGVDDQSNELVLGIVGKHAMQSPIHGLMHQ